MTSHSDPNPGPLWNASRQTSHEAYESVKPTLTSIRLRIADALAVADRTDDEMEVLTGLRHQTLSATRRGMVKDGLVEPTGDRRKTRSGRSAQVWRLVR